MSDLADDIGDELGELVAKMDALVSGAKARPYVTERLLRGDDGEPRTVNLYINTGLLSPSASKLKEVK